LQDALNTVWGGKAKPGGGIWAFLRSRFLSFAMVGGFFFLLLVSLTIESVLKALSHYTQSVMPGGVSGRDERKQRAESNETAVCAPQLRWQK
jgi:uncharacterized BrkB/YihY/UPF0761 family membrane protein